MADYGVHVMISAMRTVLFRLCLAAAAVAASGVAGHAGFAQDAAKHFATNEDLRHAGALGNPQLSPDGHSVLVQVSESTADGAKSHLWLLDLAANSYRQLTYSPDADKQGEHGGVWFPDGESVLFLAHRGEHTQLWRLPMHGGEATAFELKVKPVADASKLPGALPPAGDAKPAADAKSSGKETAAASGDDAGELPLDVASFAAAPDGKTIAILANDPQTPGEKKQGEAKADATWVDHNVHGTRLYLLDVGSGKLTLSGVPVDVHSVAWSRDSAHLAVLAEDPDNVGDLRPAAVTWLVTAAEPVHPSRIAEAPATIEAASWSLDGKSLFYVAQASHETPPGYSDLYAMELNPRRIADLSADFTGTVGHEAPIPTTSGGVVLLASVGTQAVVTAYSARHRGAESLSLGIAHVQGLQTNQAQTGWVFLGDSGAEEPAIYYTQALGKAGAEASKPRALKTPPFLPAHLQAVEPKLVQWKSEHMTVEGLLYLPPQAAQGRVPLIVDVHGGPLGAFEDGYELFVDFLLGHGWAVLRTNPRGSTNYGAKFAAANKNDLGGGDYRDIMAGVEKVIATEPIDANRMALMGYSYGGEMAAFVEGKTTRFKAIVSGAPVIDQYSEYGTESSSWYDRWYFSKPWEQPADAWRQSPLSLAAHGKTPMLLLQGEADTTDPLGQSEEMYRALRQAGVPVDLVTYPRENHGPLAMGIFGAPSVEPWHGFDARQRIEIFLKKYLQ